jgi:hypothetical protein
MMQSYKLKKPVQINDKLKKHQIFNYCFICIVIK